MPNGGGKKFSITAEQCKKFLTDPEILTLEILFVFLTLCNVFILYRILFDICPFPIFLTWSQILIGFSLAFLFGVLAVQFPKCALFPPFEVDWSMYKSLGFPTIIYLGSIILTNVILSRISSVSSFPTAISLAVVFHHVCRFVGCGQLYLPIRWIAIAIMFVGCCVALIDPLSIGIMLLPAVLGYAICSAVFRGWLLEKVMHAVNGRGNSLYNHQVILGLLGLPFIWIISGELEIFDWMPTDFSVLFTWKCWGTLVVAGVLPFLKHIIANRLLRRTGQAPWRILEVISMLAIFVLGSYIWDKPSVAGTISIILVTLGRLIAGIDALSKGPLEISRPVEKQPAHEMEPPSCLHSLQYETVTMDYSVTEENDNDLTANSSTRREIIRQYELTNEIKDECLGDICEVTYDIALERILTPSKQGNHPHLINQQQYEKLADN